MKDQALHRAIHYFGLQVNTIEEVPESHSAEVRIIRLKGGEKVVLKLPWNEQKFHREYQAYQKLDHLAFVPKLLDSMQDEKGTALLLEYKNGIPIQQAQVVTNNMAAHLGEMMAQLHLISMEDFDGQVSWRNLLHSNFQRYLNTCRSHEALLLYDEAEELFDRYAAIVPEYTQPCLTHFDLRLGNILYQQQQLVAIIDFEAARGGAGDMDFFKLWRTLWKEQPSTRQALLAAYESTIPILVELDRLLPFYLLYHSLAGICWCILRQQTDRSFFMENQHSLKEAISLLKN